MHQRAGQSLKESGFMQMREIPALPEPVFINRAFLAGQEIAWDRIHNKLPLLAFFYIFFFDGGGSGLHRFREDIDLFRSNIDY